MLKRAALFVCLSAAPSPGLADRAALQAACFPAATLASTPQERAIQRNTGGRGVLPPTETAVSANPTAPNLRGAIRRVQLPPGRKLIALTFDFCELAGEITGYDGAIIDYLRANRVKATLFAGGKWMTSHTERSKQLITDPLFEIGTHGWAHRNTRLLAGPALQSEITAPSAVYQNQRRDIGRAQCAAPHQAALSTVPDRIRLFRFPFGSCHAEGLATAAQAGLLSIQWDVSTGDPWPLQSARAIADTMIRQVKPGSIILAHGNGRGHHTTAALPLALPKLRAMGYEFVTVSELLAAGEPVITPTCYDSRPGDTDKYDTLFAPRVAPNVNAIKPSLPR
jgi:peptidoglycan-N-acetylglucosamine deacetylase